MPAIIWSIEAVTVSGVFKFGDTGAIVPKSAEKNYLGSGAVCTGDAGKSLNFMSVVNTNDLDISDTTTHSVK